MIECYVSELVGTHVAFLDATDYDDAPHPPPSQSPLRAGDGNRDGT
jgi:hypothetical protein